MGLEEDAEEPDPLERSPQALARGGVSRAAATAVAEEAVNQDGYETDEEEPSAAEEEPAAAEEEPAAAEEDPAAADLEEPIAAETQLEEEVQPEAPATEEDADVMDDDGQPEDEEEAPTAAEKADDAEAAGQQEEVEEAGAEEEAPKEVEKADAVEAAPALPAVAEVGTVETEVQRTHGLCMEGAPEADAEQHLALAPQQLSPEDTPVSPTSMIAVRGSPTVLGSPSVPPILPTPEAEVSTAFNDAEAANADRPEEMSAAAEEGTAAETAGREGAEADDDTTMEPDKEVRKEQAEGSQKKEHRHRRHHRHHHRRHKHRKKEEEESEPKKKLSRWDKYQKELETQMLPCRSRREMAELRAKEEAKKEEKRKAREERHRKKAEKKNENNDDTAQEAEHDRRSQQSAYDSMRESLADSLISKVGSRKRAASPNAASAAPAKRPAASPATVKRKPGRPPKDSHQSAHTSSAGAQRRAGSGSRASTCTIEEFLEGPARRGRTRSRVGSSPAPTVTDRRGSRSIVGSQIGSQRSRGRPREASRPKPDLAAIAKAVKSGSYREVVKACESAKKAGGGMLTLRDDLILTLTERPLKDKDSEDSVNICEYLVQHLGLDFDVQDELKQTPLFHTVAKDLQELTGALISFGADVNHVNKKGETPMYVAAKVGSYGCVKELLQSNAQMTAGNSKHLVPLIVATEEGKLNIMQLLLDNGANVKEVDAKGRTALFFAKNPESIETLLQADADINAQDKYGQTALFFSARLGDRGMTNVLLQWKADVHVVDSNKQTALHFATHKNQLTMCKMLFDAGADPTCKDKNGTAPKDLALESTYKASKEMSKLYKKFLQVWKPGRPEGREYAARSHPDHFDPTGLAADNMIPFQLAVDDHIERTMANQATSRLEQLIDHMIHSGVDVNTIAYPEGRTVLCEAAVKNGKDTCRLFLERGADPNRPDATGCTPLFHAASKDVDLCRMLIEHKADVNYLDNNGRSCLFNAVDAGHMPVCEYLLEQSCNANLVDNREHTALVEAILAGHSSISLLIFRNTEVAVGHSISIDELSIIVEKAKALGLEDISSFFQNIKVGYEKERDLAAELEAHSDDDGASARSAVRSRGRRSKAHTKAETPRRGRSVAETPYRGRSASKAHGKAEEERQAKRSKAEKWEERFPGGIGGSGWYALKHVTQDDERIVSAHTEDLQTMELMKDMARSGPGGNKQILDFLEGRNFTSQQPRQRRKV